MLPTYKRVYSASRLNQRNANLHYDIFITPTDARAAMWWVRNHCQHPVSAKATWRHTPLFSVEFDGRTWKGKPCYRKIDPFLRHPRFTYARFRLHDSGEAVMFKLRWV